MIKLTPLFINDIYNLNSTALSSSGSPSQSLAQQTNGVVMELRAQNLLWTQTPPPTLSPARTFVDQTHVPSLSERQAPIQQPASSSSSSQRGTVLRASAPCFHPAQQARKRDPQNGSRSVSPNSDLEFSNDEAEPFEEKEPFEFEAGPHFPWNAPRPAASFAYGPPEKYTPLSRSQKRRLRRKKGHEMRRAARMLLEGPLNRPRLPSTFSQPIHPFLPPHTGQRASPSDLRGFPPSEFKRVEERTPPPTPLVAREQSSDSTHSATLQEIESDLMKLMSGDNR